MSEESVVLGVLNGATVVSVFRVECAGSEPVHKYELVRDGSVLHAFCTLKELFHFLDAQGF